MADITDFFGKASIDTDYAQATTVKTTRTPSETILAAFDLSKFAQDTPVYFVTYQKEVDPVTNEVTIVNQTSWKALVNIDNNTLTNLELAPGYTDIGNEVGDYIECIPTSYWGNSLIDGISVSHNQDGTLKEAAIVAGLGAGSLPGSKIENGGITTAKIANNAVETAKINNLAVTGAKIANGTIEPAKTKLFRTQTANSGSVASSFTAGVRIQAGWGQINGDGSAAWLSQTVTFPSAFTTVLGVVATGIGAKVGSNGTSITDLTADWNAGSTVVNANDITNSGFMATVVKRDGSTIASGTRTGYTWIAWGI